MKKAIGLGFILLIVGGIAWFVFSGKINFGASGMPFLASAAQGTDSESALANKPDTIVDVPTEPVPALTKTYTNKTYKFSVQTPDDFTVQELDADENGGRAIVLQNAKGDGVQIYVTDDKTNGTVLTADDVRASIPDMRVVGEQDVEIGADGKGVAFKSDNEAYQGNSREVWFYFRGHLYQISTYARLDPLLKAMFGMWKFF